MKKDKFINISGFIFKDCGTFSDTYNDVTAPETAYWDITTAYKKPSYSKVRAWNWFKNWLYNNDDIINYQVWIASKNSFKFVICGKMKLTNGKSYIFKVTADNNYIIELVG